MIRHIEFAPLVRLWEWLTFADYEIAKERGDIEVISRYGRRSVSLQNGAMLDESGLAEISAAGDKAAKKLKDSVLSR